MDVQVARATFELENDVSAVQNVDEIYRYDEHQAREIQHAKPWLKE